MKIWVMILIILAFLAVVYGIYLTNKAQENKAKMDLYKKLSEFHPVQAQQGGILSSIVGGLISGATGGIGGLITGVLTKKKDSGSSVDPYNNADNTFSGDAPSTSGSYI